MIAPSVALLGFAAEGLIWTDRPQTRSFLLLPSYLRITALSPFSSAAPSAAGPFTSAIPSSIYPQ